MIITFQEKPEDPPSPLMAGKTAMAKEFNKRMKEMWAKGNLKKVDYELISTVLIEILADDYNKRHGSKKNQKQDV